MEIPSTPRTQVLESVAETWGVSLQSAGCSGCGQVHLVKPDLVGAVCPNCGRARLDLQPVVLRPGAPELAVPFQVAPEGLVKILAGYVKGLWIAPDDFNPAALAKRLVPVYWPMWLVDCQVIGSWQAEAGYDYQVKSSQESYSTGGWQTKEVIEKRARWESRLGQINRHYDNVTVPAFSGHAARLKMTRDYNFQKAVPYRPEMVGGAAIHAPDLGSQDVWELARIAIDQAAAAQVQTACAAQHIRNFGLKAQYQDLNWTQLLLPLYFSFYTDDDGKAHPVFINGQTGVVGGDKFASQKKGWRYAGITGAIAAAFLALAILCFIIGPVFPPLLAVATLFIILAIGIGLGAIVPAVYPWFWNRSQVKQPDR